MKKLNRDRVIADLKLLAAGANGGRVEPDDDMFPNLQTCLTPKAFANFASAVQLEWFTGENGTALVSLFLFRLLDIEKWATYETLADAIIEERKRIEAIVKQKASEQ